MFVDYLDIYSLWMFVEHFVVQVCKSFDLFVILSCDYVAWSCNALNFCPLTRSQIIRFHQCSGWIIHVNTSKNECSKWLSDSWNNDSMSSNFHCLSLFDNQSNSLTIACMQCMSVHENENTRWIFHRYLSMAHCMLGALARPNRWLEPKHLSKKSSLDKGDLWVPGTWQRG